MHVEKEIWYESNVACMYKQYFQMKSGQEEHRKTHEGADVVEFVVVGFRGDMAYFYVFRGVCF